MIITSLMGISDKRAALYKKLGVFTVEDLLSFYPRDYIDFTVPIKISETEPGEYAVIKATVEKKLKPYINNRVNLYKLVLSDDSGEILCNIWGKEYSFKSLMLSREYLFYGKIEGGLFSHEMSTPLFIPADSEEKIIPKYRLTKGLTGIMVANNVRAALKLYDIPEPFSEVLMGKYNLISRREAINKIHFPDSHENAEKARHRLIFEELLILQLGLSLLKSRNLDLTSVIMDDIDFDLEVFYNSLNFIPTGAQKRAVAECVADMKKDIPMNRLLQGDVGSGKTMVAAVLCLYSAKNGYQSAIMAPTEILANQHFNTLRKMLSPFGLETVLLTAAMKSAEKKAVLEKIKTGKADLAIGTHALIQNAVEFYNLGFAVTDEQHRFGVGQRAMLSKKGNFPHMLVMSATPIPRTLALIIYSDLDLSVLDELPEGRKAVRTYGVNSSYRERLYRFIIRNINEGRQAYIICPLIEEGASEKISAVKYYEELSSGWFREISVGLLHGRMKESEKNAVMREFAIGKISLLISTTVIEVGIDVPNANIILIENAEQFGLSQLHQLRGRVGRGTDESHCVLLSDSASVYTKARIDTMIRTSDGFEVAGEDLKMRGPGDFFGAKQHGLPELKIADMSKDISLINRSRELANEILENDPGLEKPENSTIQSMVKELFKNSEKIGFN